MRRWPGEVQQAVAALLADKPDGATVKEIRAGVEAAIGPVSSSSVGTCLRGDGGGGFYRGFHFERLERGRYRLREDSWLRSRVRRT